MADAARIYLRLAGASIRGEWQYRTSFILRVLGHGAATMLDFVELAVLFLYLRHMGGWTIEEVAFLYGIACTAFSITDIVIGHLDTLPQMIRSGNFDTLLTRPLGAMFQILSREVSFRRIGKLLQAGAVFAWAVARLNIDWTAAKIGLTALTFATATAIFVGIWIAGITICFWFIDGAEIVNTVTYGGQYVTEHPMTVFSRWIRRFAIFIAPVAFVAYFPALEILGKTDALAYPRWTAYLGVPVAAITLIVARAAWGNAVRHYRSTGS